jgi:phosphopantothenoylcysteine decarboxylase/phosphopantothenate--cysteine ligase
MPYIGAERLFMADKKRVLLGITGGIACYKAAELARLLVKSELDVFPVMTKNAMQFITPLTFTVLTGNRTATDMFDRDLPDHIPHISFARDSDLILIAPATANMIGKIANGIADDLLSTIVMSSTRPILVAPAMNCEMYRNRIVQRNIGILKETGYHIIEPEEGDLACGETGVGRLASPESIAKKVLELTA